MQIKFIEKESLVAKCNEIFANKIKEDKYATSISHISNIFCLISSNEKSFEMKNSLQLIAKILSCVLDVSSKNVFKPLLENKYSKFYFIPDNLGSDELNYLLEIVDYIQQPVLKARIADILWCYHRPKNIQHALSAIKSYISVDFIKFSADNYTFWHRAILLAQSTKQQDYLDKIKAKLLQEIDYPTNDWQFHKFKIAEIFLKTELDKMIYLDLAEKMLQEQQKFNPKSDNFELFYDYLEIAKELFAKANNQDKKIYCINLLGKATEQYGDFQIEANNSNLVANYFYKLALKIYRTIPDSYRSKYNIEQNLIYIQDKITKSGYKISDELELVEIPPMDISTLQNQSINHVKNKNTLFEAICYFSGICTFDVHRAMLNTEEQIRDFVFRNIAPTTAISKDGRTIDRIESLNSDGSNQDKVILQNTIRDFCTIYMPFMVQSRIVPAINQIQEEHIITKDFLLALCRYSSIVPEKRENLVASALYFGFEGDFSTCIHLLAPQVENMIRELFKKHGVITTHTDNDGIEHEIGLSSLLDKPQSKEILGFDLWFELQAVFTSSLSANLRNMVGHGLLDDETSNSYYVVYAWWLILKWVIWTI